MVNLGDEFPNFKAETTVGPIQFHEWMGDSSGFSLAEALDVIYNDDIDGDVFIESSIPNIDRDEDSGNEDEGGLADNLTTLSNKRKERKGKDALMKTVNPVWAILFSHPADFTPVCTTELSRVASLVSQFEERNVKVIALSCDSVESHKKWIDDIKSYGKHTCEDFPFPIIADEGRTLAVQLGMLDPNEKDKDGLPLTCRAVFILGPDKRMRLSMLYPATTGRNFDEILRVVDSLQLTENKKVATPADWKSGGDCMVLPTVKESEAASAFPKGFSVVTVPSGKSYLRVTPHP